MRISNDLSVTTTKFPSVFGMMGIEVVETETDCISVSFSTCYLFFGIMSSIDYIQLVWVNHIDGLMQERCNSIANALELHFLALNHLYFMVLSFDIMLEYVCGNYTLWLFLIACVVYSLCVIWLIEINS